MKISTGDVKTVKDGERGIILDLDDSEFFLFILQLTLGQEESLYVHDVSFSFDVLVWSWNVYVFSAHSQLFC